MNESDLEHLAQGNRRKDPRSMLMRLKSKAQKGEKVNRCPFGCKERHLDQNGYCKHLIGFTIDKVFFEPMVMRNGMRVVQVQQKDSGERELDDNGDLVPVMRPAPERCQEGDLFEEITTCFRVYRKIEEAKQKKAVG